MPAWITSLFRDDVKLAVGVDYSFNYDATNNIIRLTPLAGIWELDRKYEVFETLLRGQVPGGIAAGRDCAIDHLPVRRARRHSRPSHTAAPDRRTLPAPGAPRTR